MKIGAGVVAGAAVASVVEIPYYSSVIGGNNNSSSSTVSSLQNELQSTQSQLSDTQNSLTATQSSLNAAQGTISTLNNQLSSTQSQLGSAQTALNTANSQNTSLASQNTNLSQQLSSTQSSLSGANSTIASLQTQVSSATSAASSAQSQATSLQTQIDNSSAFHALGSSQQVLVLAVAETFIPTDSNGPGAKEAGVIHFIDNQLMSTYGNSGDMYMKPPFIQANITSSITVAGKPYVSANGNTYTVGGNTYSKGTMVTPVAAGGRYQYPLIRRQYWYAGLTALQAYANSAYGGNFETLSAANQVQVLTDLNNNKPTNFGGIVPQDFFYEMFWMVWSGFLMDPMYGGNQGMVGWILTAFNGTNQGNFYGEGFTTKELMLQTTPTRLMPASLGQFQKGSP